MGKKIKILVVEDDPIQINWAKEQLKDKIYKVTIATTVEESAILRSKVSFDLIFTDLQLPKRKGDRPSVDHGLSHLSEVEAAFYEGKVRGIAVISNFEHHISEVSPEERKRIMKKIGALWEYLAPAKINVYENGLEFVGERPVVVFADFPRAYARFQHKEGRVITRSEAKVIGEQLPPGERGFVGEIRIVQWGVAKPLKPYSEIATYLSKFCV